jgi:hypothetical protein
MRNKVLRAARSLAAVIAGYAVIVAGTILAFEVWLGGVGYYKSSTPVLAVASLAAFASGLGGAMSPPGSVAAHTCSTPRACYCHSPLTRPTSLVPA